MAQETLEEYFLANIKNVLQFGNDAQAIRFMEKYFEVKQEISYSLDEIKTAMKNGYGIKTFSEHTFLKNLSNLKKK